MTDEEKLRMAVTTIDVTNALAAPLTRSLENILRLAARAVDSEEASIIVPHDNGEDLRFLVAIGAVAEQLRDLQIPAGKGIAGFVYSSGQPIAVADVGADANFYAEVDRQTGHSTETILATPLRYNGEIIGVLEFINRAGAPPFAPFTPDEMDKAAVYADAIATLVDAHDTAGLIENMALQVRDENDLREWLRNVRAAPPHRELLELALLVRSIADLGEAEKRFCFEVLQSFAHYADRANDGQTSFLSSES